MINQYILLYAIADFLARHLIVSELLKEENGEFKFINTNKADKADRMIIKDLIRITEVFRQNLTPEGFNNIKNKYNKIHDNIMFSKKIVYYPVFVALELLSLYTNKFNEKDRVFKIHKNRVNKLQNLIYKHGITEQGEKVKLLEKTTLVSIELARKFYKALGGEI